MTATTAQELRVVHPSDSFHTGEHLRNAAAQARQRNYSEFTIVDVDAHHYETESWAQIVEYINEPIMRHFAVNSGVSGMAASGLTVTQPGNQDMSGRIVRYPRRAQEERGKPGSERDVLIVKRAMDAIGIDYQVLFPTPMLNLGLHPQSEVEVAVARAYARWVTERVLAADPAIKTMLYLPFSDPDACVRMVEEYAGTPGVVGFMVTSIRREPVHSNAYMRLYRVLEESGQPLGFHAGYSWRERSMETMNKFISVHALSFPFYLMTHLTNWLVNGIPERFPGLKVMWIEGGLAWIPFLMQRLDNEYAMRSSEAPLLRRKPSEYMREMFYTSQPMEIPDDPSILEATFSMIDAPNQLMYSSDYPHWDFDLPSTIYDLSFLDEQAKRAILGGNACRLFGLPEK